MATYVTAQLDNPNITRRIRIYSAEEIDSMIDGTGGAGGGGEEEGGGDTYLTGVTTGELVLLDEDNEMVITPTSEISTKRNNTNYQITLFDNSANAVFPKDIIFNKDVGSVSLTSLTDQMIDFQNDYVTQNYVDSNIKPLLDKFKSDGSVSFTDKFNYIVQDDYGLTVHDFAFDGLMDIAIANGQISVNQAGGAAMPTVVNGYFLYPGSIACSNLCDLEGNYYRTEEATLVEQSVTVTTLADKSSSVQVCFSITPEPTTGFVVFKWKSVSTDMEHDVYIDFEDGQFEKVRCDNENIASGTVTHNTEDNIWSWNARKNDEGVVSADDELKDGFKNQPYHVNFDPTFVTHLTLIGHGWKVYSAEEIDTKLAALQLPAANTVLMPNAVMSAPNRVMAAPAAVGDEQEETEPEVPYYTKDELNLIMASKTELSELQETIVNLSANVYTDTYSNR